MSGVSGIELGRMQPAELPLAAGVAARGMRDNPSSVALFGTDPVRRVRSLEPLYHWVLAAQRVPTRVARRRGVIVGIAALSPPRQCFYRQMEGGQHTLHFGRVGIAMPAIPRHLLLPLLRVGPSALSRLSQWGEVGLRHDPPETHQHVDLVVVEAALQGLGIGRQMMEDLCKEIDTISYMAYLETDKPENARFYEHFGFNVIGEATAIGIRTWFMSRPMAADS